MLNLEETNIVRKSYTDDKGKKHTYSIVPIVTVPDEKIEKLIGKERRLEKLWNNFYKNVYKELETLEDVYLDKEVENTLKDYDNDQYAFVNYESLSALTERQRDNYSIGLRYVEEGENFQFIARPFSKEFVEKLDVSEIDSLDKEIPFEYIEKTRESALRLLQTLSKENERRINEENDDEKREESYNEEMSFSDSDDEELTENSEDNGEQEVSEQYSNSINTQDEYEEDDDMTEEEEPQEIEEPLDGNKLQNDLYNTIDNLVPNVYLEDMNMDLEFKNDNDYSHSAYTELENITIDNTLKNKNKILNRLKEERQSIVDRLYRKASTSLYRKYSNIEKLFNYESPESEYHNDFLQIRDSYQAVLDNSENQREEKFAELTRKFEEDMERRARNAYEQEKAKIEREERPLVEQEADIYLNELRQRAEEIYENEKDKLLNDINFTFEDRYHAIGDEVLDEYQSDIDTQIERFSNTVEESTNYLVNKHREDMKEVQSKIQELQKDHIQNQTEFDNRVESEVQKSTQTIREENRDYKKENESMKDRIERLERELKRNEGYIENLQYENQQKDERLKISETNAEQLKKQLMSRHQIGLENSGQHSNFNKVVAPNDNPGVGNQDDNVVATEKVGTPLKDKIKHPLMITIFAVSLGSVGLLGASAVEDSHVNKVNTQVNDTLSSLESFKKTNEGKYLNKGTTLTIRADNRLKPSTVENKKGNTINVKSFDNKTYTLKK